MVTPKERKARSWGTNPDYRKGYGRIFGNPDTDTEGSEPESEDSMGDKDPSTPEGDSETRAATGDTNDSDR